MNFRKTRFLMQSLVSINLFSMTTLIFAGANSESQINDPFDKFLNLRTRRVFSQLGGLGSINFIYSEQAAGEIGLTSGILGVVSPIDATIICPDTTYCVLRGPTGNTRFDIASAALGQEKIFRPTPFTGVELHIKIGGDILIQDAFGEHRQKYSPLEKDSFVLTSIDAGNGDAENPIFLSTVIERDGSGKVKKLTTPVDKITVERSQSSIVLKHFSNLTTNIETSKFQMNFTDSKLSSVSSPSDNSGTVISSEITTDNNGQLVSICSQSVQICRNFLRGTDGTVTKIQSQPADGRPPLESILYSAAAVPPNLLKVSIKDEFNSSIPANYSIYDQFGHAVETGLGSEILSTLIYDARNRLIVFKDKMHPENDFKFEYNKNDIVKTKLNAQGTAVYQALSFDNLEFLPTSIAVAEQSGIVSIVYDSLGRMVQSTSGAGVTDVVSRSSNLSSKSFSICHVTKFTQKQSCQNFASDGKITSNQEIIGGVTELTVYAYDSNRLLSNVVRSVGANKVETSTYDYDQKSRIIKLAVSNDITGYSRSQTFVYNDSNQMVQAASSNGYLGTSTYDPAGRIIRSTLSKQSIGTMGSILKTVLVSEAIAGDGDNAVSVNSVTMDGCGVVPVTESINDQPLKASTDDPKAKSISDSGNPTGDDTDKSACIPPPPPTLDKRNADIYKGDGKGLTQDMLNRDTGSSRATTKDMLNRYCLPGPSPLTPKPSDNMSPKSPSSEPEMPTAPREITPLPTDQSSCADKISRGVLCNQNMTDCWAKGFPSDDATNGDGCNLKSRAYDDYMSCTSKINELCEHL